LIKISVNTLNPMVCPGILKIDPNVAANTITQP